MPPFRILQISDTHLSPRTEHFRLNNDLMREPLRQCDHDLIVHTGDITLDGVRYEEDHAYCRDFFGQFPKQVWFIPGNHDVGDNPALSKPEQMNGSAINLGRLERYRRFFGPDRWSFDTPAWRVIAINSMLVGSGLDEEQAQFDWMDQQLASAESRYIALFTHQPLFIDEPEPTERTYWTVDPSGGRRFRSLVEDSRLRLIASGHLHQQRSRRYGGIALEWGPSVAFTTREALVPEMGGSRQVGHAEHTLHDDGRIETRVLHIPGSVTSYLDDMIEEVYPTH
ncbi:metallophosphoesterase [Bosea sp. RAF48]|uniref:metallophosphoesterase family protein n=1 Tax=Bosea sp. RAF48 TaxID=3237480 RepID=UPI003F911554